MEALVEHSRRNQISELAAEFAEIYETAQELRDPVDYILGAIYALKRSDELGFRDRPKELCDAYGDEIVPLVAADLASCQQPSHQPWLAGFYFNSALARIAAAYERIPKVLAPKRRISRASKKSGIPANLQRLEIRVGFDNLAAVSAEVNALKHAEKAVWGGRNITFANAVEALRELAAIIRRCIPRKTKSNGL